MLEKKKMTPRVYKGIIPRVCFLEGLAWVYDWITLSLHLQVFLLPLASFYVVALTPYAQGSKEGTNHSIATSDYKP
jgi:hypothetical protein